MKKRILFLFMVVCLQTGFSQPGQLDPSFGDNGTVLNFGHGAYGNFQALAIQPDKKIVVADSWRAVLCRYNLNGSLDSTFGTDGEQVANTGFAIAVQPDNKIVMVGYDAVSRYDSNGARDKTFNKTGIQTVNFGAKYNYLSSVAIQADGKVVVAGYAGNDTTDDFAIARYNSNGTLDKSFSGDGKQLTSFNVPSFSSSTVIQGDGKILVAGAENIDFRAGIYNGVIARYNTDGSLDNDFKFKGKLTTDFYVTKIALQKDGKIIATGISNYPRGPFNFVVTRFNSNGSTDDTFNGNGKQITSFNNEDAQAQGIAIQSDGKIVVGGYGIFKTRAAVALTRYNNDGRLDSSFALNGLQETFGPANNSYYFGALAILEDKAYVTGSNYRPSGSSGMLLRYTLDEGKTTKLQFTSPVYNHGFYTGPATINLAVQVNKEDPADTVRRVEFYTGDSLLYADIAAPFAYAWMDVHDGEYLVTAKAITKQGVVATSSINVSVLPDKAPFVEIDQNYPAWHFSAPLDLQLSVTTRDEDPDGKISKVEFYNGSTLLYTDSLSPYNFTWKQVPVGDYVLTVKATDNSGLFTSTPSIPFTVDPNTPPVINITNPLNNQYFQGPGAAIDIYADARDGYGVVRKVEFYNGSMLLSTDSVYPYKYRWNNVPTGEYTLTAVVTDNSGLAGTSTPIHVFVASNLPPAIKVVNPRDGASFIAPASMFLGAWAKDGDGVVTKVEFFAGDTLIGIERNRPFARRWNHVPAGRYTLTAKATDNSGNVTISAPVKIIVKPDTAPLVTIISPANNRVFVKGETINLEATASDIDGTVRKVVFYSGTTLLATEKKLPYTYDWQVSQAGNYTITAVATDNLGAVSISAPIYVTVVEDQQPMVHLINPADRKVYVAPATINFESPGVSLAGGVLHTGSAIKSNSNLVPGLYLSPNPAGNLLNIVTTGLQPGKKTVLAILSASGAILQTKRLSHLPAVIQLDVSYLASGLYFIKLNSGGNVMYKSFVKS